MIVRGKQEKLPGDIIGRSELAFAGLIWRESGLTL